MLLENADEIVDNCQKCFRNVHSRSHSTTWQIWFRWVSQDSGWLRSSILPSYYHMSSYLRDWFFGSTVPLDTAAPSVPTVELISPPASDDEDGEETETEHDNDSPPAFPALNSAQRLQSTTPRVLTDSQLMPPPPVPYLSVRQPGVPLSSSRGSTSTPSSLAVPPSTTKAPVKKREKVALAPGHSPLDWAALKSSGKDLRVSNIKRSFKSWPHSLVNSIIFFHHFSGSRQSVAYTSISTQAT